MDMLILGGGYGTRLSGSYNAETYVPKGLVDIQGCAGVERIITTFSPEHLDRIILETNNEGKPFYEIWLKESGWSDRAELFVEKTSTPHACLGLLETIAITRRDLDLQNPLLIVSPDNLFEEKQDELITGYQGGSHLAIYTVPTLDEATKYGVVELDGTTITHCVEKPAKPSAKTVRTSCEIWDQPMLTLLEEWNRTGDSDKVGSFINYAIQQSVPVSAHLVQGKWIDIGNEQALAEGRKMVIHR